MNFLKDYNSNLYVRICFFLNQELERLENFITQVRDKKEYKQLFLLENMYKEVFKNELLIDYILVNIERVLNPHYSRVQVIEAQSGNSSFFISIKIVSDSLLKIDILYQKQLTMMLRLFKNLFSLIDAPNYILHDDLLKYQLLMKEINMKMRDYLLALDNKIIIDLREKLKENIIKNLPHNGFYHMTHIENLSSILDKGLLSHNRVYNEKIIKVDISNRAMQEGRDRPENVFGRSIHEYVPLYINPQNPMMGSEKVKRYGANILLLEVIPHILVQEKNTLFSDGNASLIKTNFYRNQLEMEKLDWELLQEGVWVNGTDSQRIMCSEILIPDLIYDYYISKIILKDDSILNDVANLFPNHKGIEIVIDETYFKTQMLN